jgi:hypothetical protein
MGGDLRTSIEPTNSGPDYTDGKTKKKKKKKERKRHASAAVNEWEDAAEKHRTITS